MLRYHFPIFHNGETQADDDGEIFSSADLAVQYGARVARDIANDPEHDHGAGTVVIVVDASDAEIARRAVRGLAHLSVAELAGFVYLLVGQSDVLRSKLSVWKFACSISTARSSGAITL